MCVDWPMSGKAYGLLQDSARNYGRAEAMAGGFCRELSAGVICRGCLRAGTGGIKPRDDRAESLRSQSLPISSRICNSPAGLCRNVDKDSGIFPETAMPHYRKLASVSAITEDSQRCLPPLSGSICEVPRPAQTLEHLPCRCSE